MRAIRSNTPYHQMTAADLPLDQGLPANLLKLNNDFADNLSSFDVEGARQLVSQCFMAAHVEDMHFFSRSTKMLPTTTQISSGSSDASTILSMSIARW
jgi:hypothetical protein